MYSMLSNHMPPGNLPSEPAIARSGRAGSEGWSASVRPEYYWTSLGKSFSLAILTLVVIF